MTTIAWDGKSVAADSMKTIRNGYERRSGSFQKLRRDGDVVYAITGIAALFDALIAWHKSGANPESMPKGRAEDHTSFLVFEGGKCKHYSTSTPYPEELFAPDAFGMGCDYALGAMHAGADAKRAVEIAIICNPQTGGDVQVVDLTFQTQPKLVAAE